MCRPETAGKTPSLFGAIPSLRMRCRGFFHDRNGNAAVMFAIALMPLLALAGGALDVSRWLWARQQTLSALDAAVLAGGRELQLGGNEQVAVAAANSVYAEATKTRDPGVQDNIGFIVRSDAEAFGSKGTGAVRTMFLGLLGVPDLPLFTTDATEHPTSLLRVGSNAETRVEISLALDVSSWLAASGTVLAVKKAAEDFIDIVVWRNQSHLTSRLAIISFSDTVRLPDNLISDPQSPNMVPSYTGPSGAGLQTTRFVRTDCVVERKGPEKYTDAPPGPGRYVMPHYESRSLRTCRLPKSSVIVPLSNDRTRLRRAIAEAGTGGGIAGHIGLAWAWYLLSPAWADVVPSRSEPQPYNSSNVRKVAVLVTGGLFRDAHSVFGINFQHAVHAPQPSGPANTNPDQISMFDWGSQSSSLQQTRSLCAGMKSKDIEIFVIQNEAQQKMQLAEAGDDGLLRYGQETMERCATSQDHYYLAPNAPAIAQAFRDIALKISTTYISN